MLLRPILLPVSCVFSEVAIATSENIFFGGADFGDLVLEWCFCFRLDMFDRYIVTDVIFLVCGDEIGRIICG